MTGDGLHRGFVSLAGQALLAPEHPFPSALDDALASYRALVAKAPVERLVAGGESAGGALVIATLVAARQEGLPLPRAVTLFSPVSDITRSGDSYRTKAEVDPIASFDALGVGFETYTGGTGYDRSRVSPLYADLSGLPPVLIQVGTYEVLLDDSTRLASRLAAADAAVTFEAYPRMTHVFQSGGAASPDAQAALGSAGRFLRAHLDDGD